MKLFRKNSSGIPPTESSGGIVLRPGFLDSDEINFYQSLAMAVGNRGYISCKTRAINVVDLEKASANLSQAVRLNLKTIHFLVCDQEYFQPLIAIQVCRSKSGRGVKSDPFLVEILKIAELPLLTVDLAAQPSVKALQKILKPLFTRSSIDATDQADCQVESRSANTKKTFSGTGQSMDAAHQGPPNPHADPAKAGARKK